MAIKLFNHLTPPTAALLQPIEHSEHIRDAAMSVAAPKPILAALHRTTRVRGTRGRFKSRVAALGRKCAACGRTQTSQWRTGPHGQSLCNACGIRVRRPQSASARARKGRKQNCTSFAAQFTLDTTPPLATTRVMQVSRFTLAPSALISTTTILPSIRAAVEQHRFTLQTPYCTDRREMKRHSAYSLNTILNPI